MKRPAPIRQGQLDMQPEHQRREQPPHVIDRPLPQGLFELSHPDLGALEIFLVPVGVDGTRHYEAVFNRSAVEGET